NRKNTASVFYNRLKSGMSLGSDVTTYYAFKISMADRDLTVDETDREKQPCRQTVFAAPAGFRSCVPGVGCQEQQHARRLQQDHDRVKYSVIAEQIRREKETHVFHLFRVEYISAQQTAEYTDQCDETIQLTGPADRTHDRSRV
ncbi:MAG: endolytic transglycosylase MltG, partial [Lentisphaeria bacterium]|nr:endolytic transglycosylase MltG [Lentisphaeria bacterium]